MSIGQNPPDAASVNIMVGTLCRQFVAMAQQVARFQSWMSNNDLKVAPYGMSAADETNIKNAVAALNTALQGVNRAVVDKLTGLF
jgi:hypothetical protein